VILWAKGCIQLSFQTQIHADLSWWPHREVMLRNRQSAQEGLRMMFRIRGVTSSLHIILYEIEIFRVWGGGSVLGRQLERGKGKGKKIK
jgi:hypothetical protein